MKEMKQTTGSDWRDDDDAPPFPKLLPNRALLEPLASGFPIVSSVIIVRAYSQGPGIALSTFEFSK